MTERKQCPECADEGAGFDRRHFLASAGAAALAAVAPAWTPVWADSPAKPSAETFAHELYLALSPEERKAICFPYDHEKRKRVSANWAIVDHKIADFDEKKQALAAKIFNGLASPEGVEKFKVQMEEDAGGLDQYHLAFFGKPGDPQFEAVITGRHCTARADGKHNQGAAFAGPMVYGHQAETDPEKPGHPGNVFWYQAKRANEVFGALEGKQRQAALLDRAPKESDIRFRKEKYAGLAVGEMTRDQKELVQKVMHDLLSPFRAEDAAEAMQIITANGGLDKIRMAFYSQDEAGKSADLGDDKTWDIWRLEGPGFVWHFRGAPHVHVWVNIARV